MPTERICPGCQKPLPPDVPLGLCPACLVRAGFSTGTEPGAGDAGFAPPPVEELAKLFPQFEIFGLIGRGGMGAVYHARQPTLDRFIALKLLRPDAARDPGFAERFQREARALARLSHPNIVAVHDFGHAGGLAYLVMEFVDGANLRALERAGRIAPEQALQIVPQICDALEFAHREGIVHRDIKPENILLDSRGRVKITDFGIAKIVGVPAGKIALTGARDIVGTPHYMAPEQVERPGTVDHRADIFSLGVVFYELLTGELPLGRFAPPSRKVQVDVRLDDIVLRALEKEPERRYQTALQVKTDVESISSAPPPAPSPAPGAVLAGAAASAAAKSRGSRKGVIIALVVSAAAFTILVAVALVVTVLFVTRSRREHALAQARLRTEGQISNLQSVLKETARQSPAPAAAPARELSAVEFTGLVADLKSPNAVRRRIALSRLATVKPVEPREDVVKELIAALDDTEWGTRGSAARALGVWGTAAAVEPLIKSLEDPEFTVRWAAINSLAQLKSPEAAVPVARVLARGGTDALQAEQALKALGPPAEEPVIGLLGARDNDTRRHACRILQEIGTAKSIPALTAAASDADGITAMLAKAALEAIASQKRREIYFRSRSGNVSVETAQPETNKIQP